MLTTAIAFQSLPDSSVEFLERVYETAYFLKTVTAVPATSTPQTTEQDETLKVESGSTSADERKKRVILRLAHLVSCDTNAFVSGSVGLGGAEVMAMARSVSPKIVKGVLKASELLLSQMSPAGACHSLLLNVAVLLSVSNYRN